MEEIQKTEIHYVEKNSSIYPARLRELSGMPKQLYYIGRFPEDNKPTAAIVGARLCSAYGRIQAFRYGKFLSEHGVQVISGMAAGIDAEGHKGALEGGTPTFHPAVGFIGGFRRRTEGSSVSMNLGPEAGLIIFRQGTGSSADLQTWCL